MLRAEILEIQRPVIVGYLYPTVHLEANFRLHIGEGRQLLVKFLGVGGCLGLNHSLDVLEMSGPVLFVETRELNEEASQSCVVLDVHDFGANVNDFSFDQHDRVVLDTLLVPLLLLFLCLDQRGQLVGASSL